MSLASCDKCWDDTCLCGWKYRHIKDEDRYHLINEFIKSLTVNESSPLQAILDKIKARANASGIQ